MKLDPTRREFLRATGLGAGVGILALGAWAAAADPLGPEDFEALHALLKPRAGESRWMEIDWHPSVWEARRKGAAEGKPIFLMAGSGGAPAAGC
jgi:hypothetical protein